MNRKYPDVARNIDSPTDVGMDFSFCTLVTQPDEYAQMLNSALTAGFTRQVCEFLYADNSATNHYTAYSALSAFYRHAHGRYLVYCHQDVRFDFDGYQQLVARLEELNRLDPDWALAGNAGKTFSGYLRKRITDPSMLDAAIGPFPARVMSLDENFIVIRHSAGVTTSNGIAGFHLYGTVLAQNAQYLGYHAYVIDFHLRHLSAGNVDLSYRDLQQQFGERLSASKRGQFIQAMCSRFYVGSNPLLVWLFNRKWLLNLHRSLKKRFRPDAVW